MNLEADLRARISILEEQLAEAREIIAWHEGGGGLDAKAEAWLNLRRHLGVTPKGAALLRRLYERQGTSTHADLEATGWGEELPHEGAVRVEISKARRVLPPGAIENLHGIGYRMTDEARAYIAGLLAGAIYFIQEEPEGL